MAALAPFPDKLRLETALPGDFLESLQKFAPNS